MKRTLFLITALLLATLSQTALADNRHHRNDWGWNSHYRYDRNHYRSYSRHNDYFSYGWSNHRHYDRFDGGEFVGGLVLGSLLSQPSRPRYETRVYSTVTVPPAQEVTVIKRSSSSTVSSVPKRRLLKDLQGRCFERNLEDGQEVMVELEPEACNF